MTMKKRTLFDALRYPVSTRTTCPQAWRPYLFNYTYEHCQKHGMASLLRRIVAGPRAPHPEANLDLCYVTDNVIATSGPAGTFPTNTYRNPLPQLVKWLDDNHGDNWAIWEFRAEGTGYPDQDVYGRVHHFPWPDHHPPPFHLIPSIMATMRDWAQGIDLFPAPATSSNPISRHSTHEEKADKKDKRVIVVHCKAGKGRSGSMACSYLMSERGWKRDDALQRFTDRRMRPGFGAGVSIPSQLRWIGYVERWVNAGKIYVEQRVQITEVHVWGLRDGVKLAIEGYIDQGKKIKTAHVFDKKERDDRRKVGDIHEKGDRKGNGPGEGGTQVSTSTRNENENAPHVFDVVSDVMKRRLGSGALSRSLSKQKPAKPATKNIEASSAPQDTPTEDEDSAAQDENVKAEDVIFRPANPIYLSTNDVNLSVERRARASASYNWFMVTSVAHVWFNAFFEGNGPENMSEDADKESGADMKRSADSSGVFHIQWEHMDGLKGSRSKGIRAFDRAAVVWRVVPASDPIAPATKPEATPRESAPSKVESTASDEPDPRGASGVAIKNLQRQATSRSRADSTPTAAPHPDEAQGGNVVREPSQGKDAREPGAANWSGADPIREGPQGEEDRGAEELERAAHSDAEDEQDGVRRGITAAYDGAAKMVETVSNAVLGTAQATGASEKATTETK